ncbi:hypothetical protein ABIE50_002364 [Chitinophaga sp. OAE865]
MPCGTRAFCLPEKCFKKRWPAHRGTADAMRPPYRRTIIMELQVKLKKHLLTACLAAVTTFAVQAQHSNSPGRKQAAPLPVIHTDSLVRPWQWRQYLQTVSDSTGGRSSTYGTYLSQHRHTVTHNWEATPAFRWNDIASITAIALLGYFMSR